MSFWSNLKNGSPLFGGDEPEGAQPTCVELSILNAWAWGNKKKMPVRIAVQHIEPGIDHAQAEALIDEKWAPLSEFWTGEHLEIRPDKRQFDIEPYRYVPLKEWIDQNIGFVE